MGVDDFQLMDALPTEQFVAQQMPKRYPSLMAASERHYDPPSTERPSTAAPFVEQEPPRQAEPPLEGKTDDASNSLMPIKMNKFGMSPSLGSAIVPTKPETLFPMP